MASQKGYHEIVECILNPQNPIKVDIAAMNADVSEFLDTYLSELCHIHSNTVFLA